MTDLIRFRNGIPQWPYSGEMLRADEPRLSLSRELPDHELATLEQVGVYVTRPQYTDPPEINDLRTERVEIVMPILQDGVWVQQWNKRDATPDEIAAYDAENTPPPDYIGFYQALLISVTYQQGVLPCVITNSLPTLMIFESQFGEARNGRAIPDALQASLWILLQELQPTTEMQAELQSLLQEYHLAAIYTLDPPVPG